MPTSNPWLTPYQRSYNDIKNQIINTLRNRVPEITDYSEGNIFIIIVGIFAAIAEVIHYYIDNMAREAFLPTARRYSSLYKHAKLVDYHIKSAYPASVDLTLFRSSGKQVTSDIIIPVNTEFSSQDGKVWLTSKSITWPAGTYSVVIPVVQKEKVGDPNKISFGQVTTQDAIIYLGDLPSDKKYVEGSMLLYIGGEPWTLVTTFAYASAIDRVYKVEVDENLKPYIIFGDGRFGMKPDLNKQVEGSYYLTYGESGNVSANSFTTVPTYLTDYEADIQVVNNSAASGGSNYETFDMLKEHIPLSVKTLGVAITKEDYEAIVKLIPGVDKAYVNYICGRYVDIYISPDNGGEASQALVDEVSNVITRHKVITTSVSVKSTHGCLIYIVAEITGRKSFSKNDIEDQVKQALIGAYNYNTSDINKVVRLSDIYALIDNQNMVDYVSLKKLYLLPYPQPRILESSSENVPALNITSYILNSYTDSNNSIEFTVEIINDSTGDYKIYEATNPDTPNPFKGKYGENLTVSLPNRVEYAITIGNFDNGLVYNTGDKYKLIISRMADMNNDLTPPDFNIPIFRSDTIQLTVHEVV